MWADVRFEFWLQVFQLVMKINGVSHKIHIRCFKTQNNQQNIQQKQRLRLFSNFQLSEYESAPYFITLIKDQQTYLRLSATFCLSLFIPALFSMMPSPNDTVMRYFALLSYQDSNKLPLTSTKMFNLLGVFIYWKMTRYLFNSSAISTYQAA